MEDRRYRIPEVRGQRSEIFTLVNKSVLCPLSSAVLFLILALFLMHCGSSKECIVLIHMMPGQEQYFRQKVIPPFEKKNRCKVNIVTYKEYNEIDQTVRQYPQKVALVKTPFDQTRRLAYEGLFMCVDSAAGTEKLKTIQEKYFLLKLATLDNKLYYFPRKFETRIMIYLKSKVNEAVFSWGTMSEEIDSVLKKYNGFGLPVNFYLEEDPNTWDYYDLFVVGYYWSRKEPGKINPKVAHRGKRYSGTSQRLVDRVYQLGGEQKNVLNMEGECVVDLFEWEAVYAMEKIFNPKMWKERWSGRDIWQGFKSGDVYLSFMTQVDCFFIHGLYTEEMPGFVDNPEDLGFALMPKGVSFQLDKDGNYLRKGKRSVSTGGWWWGIPKDTPSRKLSVKLAEWILNTENQLDGCARFGMIPVRKDILGDIGLLFGKGWISEIYNVSLKQIVENRYTTVPLTRAYKDLELIYLDAWHEIVVKGDAGLKKNSIDHSYIKNKIKNLYAKKARKLANR
jgi:ABC-type glycerol-3-phosphate transport system substrate-binding protein